MVMGKKVWAICRGAVRWDFELYSTLAMLCDYRSRGLIEGIVFPTWKGEADKLPNLRQKLKDLNIYLIELDTLDESIENFIHMNFARQAYQLKSGLDFVPDDVFVLSCRTDFSENIVKIFEDILLGKADLTIGSYGGLNIRQNYRVAVMRFPVDRFFGCVDRGFLGYKDDLYKMIRLEMTQQKYGMKIVPDVAFAANMFMDFPIIEEFLKAGIFGNKALFLKIKECLENNKAKKEFELPTMLNKLYALYFVLLKECFYLTNKIEEKIESFDIADIFAVNPEIGMFSDSFSAGRFRNSEILRMIIDGECKQTKGYIKLLREIGKMSQPGYAEHIYCTREDYNEMAIWIRNFLKTAPKKLMNLPNMIYPVNRVDFGFNEALKVFFSDCNIKEEQENNFYTMMRDICFNRSKGFYAAIIDNFENIQNMGQTLVEMALPPANRALTPEILKISAKRLFYGEVEPTRVESTQYIFRKMSGKGRFYAFPLPSDHISALYFYGKYAEPLGENDVPKAFYTKLMQTFQLSERPVPEYYADAVLELIKEVVDTSYKEYKENLSIQYLIDFLIDESLIDILTKETSEFLQEYIWDKKYVLPFKKGALDAFSHLLNVASEIQEETTAKYIISLILREKSGQSTYMKTKAQKIVNSLAEKYNFQNCWFIRASNLKCNEKIEINKEEITDNNDFFLLVRILADKKCLRKNNDIVLNLCSKDPVRYTIFYVLLRKEFDTRIQIFGMKNGKEIWMNYTDFMNTGYDQNLTIGKNTAGIIWPQAESASKSSYAGYLKVIKDTLVFSIEFNACKNTAKEELLKSIDKTDLLDFNMDAKLIRFNKAKIAFDLQSPDSIHLAVNHAVDEFCRIGDMLTASAIQLNETS